MKNVKLLAAALMFAAAGAYAGTDDGNVAQNVRSNQVAASQQQKQAPAPVASGSQAEVRSTDSSIVSPNP
jgi:outer membrane protein W